MAPEATNAPVLPVAVVGLVDIGRLIRELEKLEQLMQSSQIREGAEGQLPKLSFLLEQLAEANKINLADDHNRNSLLEFLRYIRKSAPRVHMSFSADPSPEFLTKLMTWLRRHIHPHVLVAVGLQPGIGAGCMLRTTNKFFDMSLGKSFSGSREILMKRMREGAATAQPAASAVPAPQPAEQGAAS